MTDAPNSTIDPLKDLDEKLTELRLSSWLPAIREDVSIMTPAMRDVVVKNLMKWSALELANRNTTTIASRIKSALFGKIQTVDGFDFGYNKATQKLKDEYLRLHRDVSEGRAGRCILVGTAGLGKTHLARSLGYAACQSRQTAYFTSAAQMINRLRTAKMSSRLESELHKYRRPRNLIIDELCYVTMDTEDSNLLFQVISARHDADLGTIATSNIPFGEWNQMLSSNAIAHALVDRLTDGASVFYLEGVSYREARQKQRKK